MYCLCDNILAVSLGHLLLVLLCLSVQSFKSNYRDSDTGVLNLQCLQTDVECFRAKEYLMLCVLRFKMIS